MQLLIEKIFTPGFALFALLVLMIVCERKGSQ